MPSDNSTFKPAFTLMSGRAAAFAITFLTPVLLVRLFTQPEFGTYKQFMLITYTPYLVGCAFSECLFYFLPKDPNRSSRYALNSLLMLFISGLVCMVAMDLNAARIATWMSNAALAPYVPIMGAYLVFMLMGTVLEITMISRKRYKVAAVTYVISDLLRAAFLVVPALLTRSLAWALAASVFFFILRVCAIFVFFRFEFPKGLHFDKSLLREQWAYAMPMSVSGIIQVIQQNYHQYAVAYHFDPATFAIYSVGCLQIPLVDFMSTPASNVMMVRMSEEIRDGRKERILPIWHDTTRKLALMFFPLVGLLLVNAYPLITFLFRTAYAASVPIFKVWCLSILLAAFQTDGVLRVFAEIKYMFSINLARLVLLLALMGWFLGTFQLMGAVLITLAGMVLAKVMALTRMRTVLETTYAELLPWKQLGGTLMVAVAAAIPSLILTTQFSIRSIVLLPLSGTAYVVTYAALALTFGLVSEGEKAAIKRSLYVWNRWNVKSGRQAGIAGGSPVDVRCNGASGT